MEGYPQLDGTQYPPEQYMSGTFGGGMEYPGVAPFEEFSTEDNQLLMSVLSSTPVSEQYNIAYPQSAQSSFQMWDGQPYNPYPGAHYGFPSGGMSPHMGHALGPQRSPHMSHAPHPNTMQHSMAAPSSQMHQQGSPQFPSAPPHNPFALHRDSPPHSSVKPENVVPVFTPSAPPYAVHGVPNNFGGGLPMPNSAHSTPRTPQTPGTPPMAKRTSVSGPSTGMSGAPPVAASAGGQQQQQQQQQGSGAASGGPPGPGGHFLRSTAHQQQAAQQQMSLAARAAAGSSGMGLDIKQQQQQQQHSDDGTSSPPSPGSNDDSPPHSANGKHSRGGGGGASQLLEDPTSADEFDDDTGPRNRRRESQNRASRNYRQRKKAYIKEMEAKLDALKLEVEVLRTENQKNKRMLSQYQGDKPAPLLRSYSSELQDEETEIEKLVGQLNEKANSPNATEEDLRILLGALHEHMGKRQQLLNKEAIQLINPKLQERFARLEATPQHQIDEQMGQWLDQVAQFVSPEQIQKLAELKQKHYEARASIWEERATINADIKTFYQEKIASERLNTPGRLDQPALMTLTHKLEELKKNLLREDELNAGSVGEFSSILTPYQEAIITVKHYAHYKDKLSAIHMLTNVWGVLSRQDK